MESWPYIQSDQDAQARQLLLQGKLFKYTCPVCGKTSTMSYNCLYNNIERRMLLLYIARGEHLDNWCETLDNLARKESGQDSLDLLDYQHRVVRTTFEFCEKARLLEEGYDDRIIELMKVAIKRGMLEEGIIGARDILIYERTIEENGGVSFIVTGEIPGDVVGVPQGYTYLKEQWEDTLNELAGQCVFDAAWANSFLP